MTEDANTAILKEMLKWVRIQGMSQAKSVLRDALKTDKDRLVYEYSDGERGMVEIAKLTGLGAETVRRYWARWATMGLVEPISVKGGTRYKKVFSLQTFGIDMPQMQDAATATQPTAEQVTLESAADEKQGTANNL